MLGHSRISIHASRGGSDLYEKSGVTFWTISIHASRGGSDKNSATTTRFWCKFQSTLPAGEATFSASVNVLGKNYFNPRFPRGKRHTDTLLYIITLYISIHASREGSDYQSNKATNHHCISIHASREGSDQLRCIRYRYLRFQSTLPAGEATKSGNRDSDFARFQSTLPAGEATKSGNRDSDFARFQSTLPAGEATRGVAALIYLSWGFQSTLPAREAT